MDEINVAQFGRIAVLFGGTSAEREISLNTGNNVLQALIELGADAVAFDPKEYVDAADRGVARLRSFDTAFIALHGAGGEDGVIQGVLEYLGIPYTGSGVLASATAMDKITTKQVWEANGLSTPKYSIIWDEQSLAACSESFIKPVMLKPSHEGSSIGMTLVREPGQFQAAFKNAVQFNSKVLVEDYIEGEEYTVAILEDRALPVIRLQAAGEFYDYAAKYQSSETRYHIPCGLTALEEQELQSLALKAFRQIGGRGWGRVDAMRDAEGQFWLLEVNTIPGMTKKSLVPMAARAEGYSFEQLVVKILATASLDSKEI